MLYKKDLIKFIEHSSDNARVLIDGKDIRHVCQDGNIHLKSYPVESKIKRQYRPSRVDSIYYLLEDDWVTEHCKTLYDDEGNSYEVLDFMTKYGARGEDKKILVQLNKPVQIYTNLYTCNPIEHEPS